MYTDLTPQRSDLLLLSCIDLCWYIYVYTPNQQNNPKQYFKLDSYD